MQDKTKNLFVVPDQVRNSSDAIVHNESTTLGNVAKKEKSYTCYIPENLDVEELIRTFPHSIPHFHKDYLIYMVHLIIDIPNRNKDKEMDYVPINSKLVQRTVRHYRVYLDYLINAGIIIEDRQYIKGLKSRGFKFTASFETKTKGVNLTRRTLIKSILEFKVINYLAYDADSCPPSLKSSIIESPYSDLGFITKWLNPSLTINFTEANVFLETLRDKERSDPKITNPDSKYMRRFTVLLKFHRGEFLHTVDQTAGRLHSVMTQLKGDLRKFIRYNNKVLVSIDIVNSQPYLSTVLLNSEKFAENKILNFILNINPKLKINNFPIMVVKRINEVSATKSTRLFIEKVAGGTFYEDFGQILLKSGLLGQGLDNDSIRKKAKSATFSAFFSPNNLISYSDEVKSFQKVFPSVYEVFKMIKSIRGKHNTLPILLQHFEAVLILHTACKKISEINPYIPLFTLHDSIITTEEHAVAVQKVMEEVLTNAIGFPPKLKIERWE